MHMVCADMCRQKLPPAVLSHFTDGFEYHFAARFVEYVDFLTQRLLSCVFTTGVGR